MHIYLNDTISLFANCSNNTTLSEIIYSTSDSSILTISNTGIVTPVSTGTAEITITETYSGKSITKSISIYNLIEVDDENPIKVSGVEAEERNGEYYILNGFAGSIKIVFKDYSTYTRVSYTSSNEKVLTVGSDGKITPKSAGKATITIVCDDGLGEEAEVVYEVTVHIKKQNAIRNMSEFFAKVRKKLGHWGAFLVLGIFSSLTYLLFFRNYHTIWSAPFNFLQGFGLAAGTEFIQTFVPGRCGCWSDIMLDFSGFISSAIPITAIVLLYYLIKFIKKLIKSRKA